VAWNLHIKHLFDTSWFRIGHDKAFDDMGVIHIDKIQPGMKLAGDVKDQTGRILLTAGHEVSERHLKIFRMWGVSEADIEGVEANNAPRVSPPPMDQEPAGEGEEAAARVRFRHVDLNHPAMRELYQLHIQRIVHSQAAGGDHVD
jgi:hypothetical protein